MGNAIQKVCGCSCTQKNENDDKEEIQSNMPQKGRSINILFFRYE